MYKDRAESESDVISSSAALREFIVAGLAKHLKRPCEEIDSSAPLFAFGLSSLEAMILLGDLEVRAGVEIDADVFSDETTIDGLVQQLADRRAATSP